MSPGRSQSSVDKTQPEVVDANLLADRAAEIRCEFKLGGLDRLRDLVADTDAAATLKGRFYRVDGNVAVSGRVTATLQMLCQRCLRPLEAAIDDEFDVVLAASEQEMAELPESQEAIIADATRLDLNWLVEEQLLLARPLAPMHDSKVRCERDRTERPDEQPVAKAETQRPFAGLRDLLKQRE